MRVAHHLMPFAALAGGILVLLMPRLLSYVVAIYLILVGIIGLKMSGSSAQVPLHGTSGMNSP